ncbi:MFS transporter, partial [Rhizobium ruizarguesonis]
MASLSATPVLAEDITLWTLNFDNNAANTALKKVATDFEAANPGTHVEIVQRAVDEHKTALRVAAGSDKGPDIYFSWAGLGLGGEWGGAVLLATENAPPGKRSWYAMFPQLGAPIGFILSSGFFLILAETMSNEDFL